MRLNTIGIIIKTFTFRITNDSNRLYEIVNYSTDMIQRYRLGNLGVKIRDKLI